MIDIKHWYPTHPLLKNIVHYFWMVKSNKSLNENHSMLPERYMSFVIDYSDSLNFFDHRSNINSNKFAFSGMRNTPYTQSIKGKTKLFGIAFYPGALYSILKVPLNQFKNYILNIDDIIPNFTEHFFQYFFNYNKLFKQRDNIEQYIVKYIDFNLLPNKKAFQLIQDIFYSNNDIILKDYTLKLGLNQKTLERVCSKYIGNTPKAILKLNRFKRIYNNLLSGNFNDLTTLSVSNGFYDQSHFIAEFKSFSGYNPKAFLKEEAEFHRTINIPES